MRGKDPGVKQSLGIIALVIAFYVALISLAYWVVVFAINFIGLIRSVCNYFVITWRERNEHRA